MNGMCRRVCKFGGTVLAARVTGIGWRDSAVLGTLMNTRGLTELIVLNLALEQGVISEALFAMLVLMALVTTFMAGPLLNALDPKRELSEPVESELDRAEAEPMPEALPAPERSILVAPQADAAIPQLLALAEPLATSEPPREVIIARLVAPRRGSEIRGGLQTQNRRLAEVSAEVERDRQELLARKVPARGVAFTSVDAGKDLAKLAEREEVDLLLVDGRRPLLGGGVPRGSVGSVLARAPCDVAVLVAREDVVVKLGPDARILVPFGGADHDWAALELAAWLGTATQAPLGLLGAQAEGGDGDASRVLASASLVLQQFVGVSAEPIITEPGPSGVIEASRGAGLLVIGLSERWRKEGLGETRSCDRVGCSRTDRVRAARSAGGGAGPADRRDQVQLVVAAGVPALISAAARTVPTGRARGAAPRAPGARTRTHGRARSRPARGSRGRRAAAAARTRAASDQPTSRNSPPFSIQLRETMGSTTIFVQFAITQLTQ